MFWKVATKRYQEDGVHISPWLSPCLNKKTFKQTSKSSQTSTSFFSLKYFQIALLITKGNISILRGQGASCDEPVETEYETMVPGVRSTRFKKDESWYQSKSVPEHLQMAGLQSHVRTASLRMAMRLFLFLLLASFPTFWMAFVDPASLIILPWQRRLVSRQVPWLPGDPSPVCL